MRDLNREQLLSQLQDLRTDLQGAGVTHLAVFGSRARGDHRQDSDLDLMVDIDPKKQLSLLDIIGIGHVVEDRLGLKAQLVLRRSAPAKFLANVAVDQIVIF